MPLSAPMTAYERTLAALRAEPRTWLVTGAAGFIGSHLTGTLLALDQRVVGLDNLSTGSPRNLDDVRSSVTAEQWKRFTFTEGTVADIGACREATRGVDYVLHQAAFISVPLSLEDPIACHDSNVTGALNLFIAARDHRVRRVVFASSSAVYGDDPRQPKVESQLGRPLSPYGASKLMDELYAGLFTDHYGLEIIGLRYFNVFGPRQNPLGGYAAVIPQWIAAMLRGAETRIHGDGTATRDFCHVANVVQANLLAATAPAATGAYNVGLGHRTSLSELHALIAAQLASAKPELEIPPPVLGPPRPGDILHSGADISKIERDLGFAPAMSVERGLEETVRWYAGQITK